MKNGKNSVKLAIERLDGWTAELLTERMSEWWRKGCTRADVLQLDVCCLVISCFSMTKRSQKYSYNVGQLANWWLVSDRCWLVSLNFVLCSNGTGRNWKCSNRLNSRAKMDICMCILYVVVDTHTYMCVGIIAYWPITCAIGHSYFIDSRTGGADRLRMRSVEAPNCQPSIASHQLQTANHKISHMIAKASCQRREQISKFSLPSHLFTSFRSFSFVLTAFSLKSFFFTFSNQTSFYLLILKFW